MEKLIAELKKRGYRVGTVKHHHGSIELDKPGKDTYRHARAGADAVVIASPEKVGLVRTTEREWSLQQLIALLPDMDIVITEGFKKENTPQIEVYRHGVSERPAAKAEQLIAVVSDIDLEREVPVYNWNDAAGVADLIEHKFLR
nr:molybdopterin-guanine dinucleotide biosynthesis protein B [Desulforadius tongensis]